MLTAALFPPRASRSLYLASYSALRAASARSSSTSSDDAKRLSVDRSAALAVVAGLV